MSQGARYVVVLEVPDLADPSIENACRIVNQILDESSVDKDVFFEPSNVGSAKISIRPLSEVIAS
jgi:sulfur relay (sulfurtransferase) complex TusBCD TusD component (DsrE family)